MREAQDLNDILNGYPIKKGKKPLCKSYLPLLRETLVR